MRRSDTERITLNIKLICTMVYINKLSHICFIKIVEIIHKPAYFKASILTVLLHLIYL